MNSRTSATSSTSATSTDTHSVRDARMGLLQISLAGVLWGTGGLGVEIVRQHEPMSVLTVSAHRMGIAAVVLLLAVVLTGRWRGPDGFERARGGAADAGGEGSASVAAAVGGDSDVCRVLKPFVSSAIEPGFEPGAEGLRGNRGLSPLSTSYRLRLFLALP